MDNFSTSSLPSDCMPAFDEGLFPDLLDLDLSQALDKEGSIDAAGSQPRPTTPSYPQAMDLATPSFITQAAPNPFPQSPYPSHHEGTVLEPIPPLGSDDMMPNSLPVSTAWTGMLNYTPSQLDEQSQDGRCLLRGLGHLANMPYVSSEQHFS